MISERTRAALAQAKAREVSLGNRALAKANRAVTEADVAPLRDAVTPLARAGLTTRAVAQALNERGLKPPRGGAWQLGFALSRGSPPEWARQLFRRRQIHGREFVAGPA